MKYKRVHTLTHADLGDSLAAQPRAHEAMTTWSQAVNLMAGWLQNAPARRSPPSGPLSRSTSDAASPGPPNSPAAYVKHVSLISGLSACQVMSEDAYMKNQRARIYAACAVKLDEDHEDAAEGTFDAALTNALVAIVAHEWPDEVKRRGDGRPKPASGLLAVIKEKAQADEAGVYLIPDPTAATEAEAPAAAGEASSIFSPEWTRLPRLDTRIDVATLEHALEATQSIRHGREEEGPPLEKKHVEALLALDTHTSLMALASEQENRYERSAGEEDQREWARAVTRLELLGEGEPSRRAAAAAEAHEGHHPKHNPASLDLQDCPVCGYTAFSSSSGDELGMQIGIGQCLVCHYERTPAIAEAEARQALYEARFAND